MDAEDDLAPANSEDSPRSGSNLRSSSLSLSQNSPSIPAEGDWVEAADLDGDRWVKAEDMDDMWGDAALPSRTVRVNDLDTYPSTIHPAFMPLLVVQAPSSLLLTLTCSPGPTAHKQMIS